MDRFPVDGSVGPDVEADEIVARLRIVPFTHRVERQVVHAVVIALVPGMDMAAEYAGYFPFLELIQQEERFFAGEGRRELEELGTENIRVRKDEGVPVDGTAVIVRSVEYSLPDEVDLRSTERCAG